MKSSAPTPGILFLDLDDTICLNQPYGCLHARLALYRPDETPHQLWEQLFSSEAAECLTTLMHECQPRVVITSTWLALFEREHFADVFRRAGLACVADAFHEHWAAFQNRGTTRLQSIQLWMSQHHRDEPILILDDHHSGESLVGSSWGESGRQVLCEVERGFHRGLLPAALQALRTPWSPPSPALHSTSSR